MEAELNKVTSPQRETTITFIDNIAQHDAQDRQNEFYAMRRKLQGFGLEEIRVDVLVYKFVFNWSFAEIADELNIPSREQAWYIYKRSLELLRERGYK